MCKTNYPELEKMVERLDNIYGIGDSENRRRVEVLQEIGKKLINEYYIQIDDVTIEPLLVEAYYFKDKNYEFIDCNCHQSPKQKGVNRFGKLYFHKIKRGGVDICLPLEEYYLSFLIKVAKVNEKVYRQICIEKELRKIPNSENRGNILKRYPSNQKHSIVCVPRKNTFKGKFAKAPLAIVSIDAFKKQESKSVADEIVKSLEHGKQWMFAKYGLEKSQLNEEEARKVIKDEKLYSSKIEDEYMESALKYIISEGK